MIQINNGFADYYYLTDDNNIYSKMTNKNIKMTGSHSYCLRTIDGRSKNVNLKKIYKMIHDKEYCIDEIENLENEEWKEIEGTKGKYFISNMGRVKSYSGYNAIILKCGKHKGYKRVELYIDGKGTSEKVHRLVAKYFCEGYSKYKDVHHIDKNRENNKYTNLICLTRDEHNRLHKCGKCENDE